MVQYGVYQRTDVEPVFAEVPASTDEARRRGRRCLHKINGRLIKLLTRRGVLIAEGATYLADGVPAPDDALARRPHAPIEMSPRVFMQRLATPVPRPCLQLMHLHGGVAPNVK